ncbi:MAG: hypothetical protein ABII88_06830 [Candidatus Omnitrophota bacterium]
MGDVIELKIKILTFLSNDNEYFEAIYFYVNDMAYMNTNTDGTPLHSKINALTGGKEYNTYIVLQTIIEMSKGGYINLFSNIKDEMGKTSLGKVGTPDFTDFEKFSKYWIGITQEGKDFLRRMTIL